MLLDGDGGAEVGARGGAAGGQAGGVHLSQVVPGLFLVHGELDVEILCHRGVHDATGENVGEATVVTCAPSSVIAVWTT